jgi:squalene-hopene/tetraprenyl-beta-curcumene cyclase
MCGPRLSKQNDDGSWGLAPGVNGDASTSIQTYLALKILGMPESSPRMLSAKHCITTTLGGLPATRMFTRVFLASFGLIPWSSLPALPAEYVFVPLPSPDSNALNTAKICGNDTS